MKRLNNEKTFTDYGCKCVDIKQWDKKKMSGNTK